MFLNCVFEIAWSADGDATFHDICWKAVLDSLRMDNPFCFSGEEKTVVEDAKRTAEYFDSMEKLEMEAGRIAEMLHSAEYAIAFTGMYVLLLNSFRGTFKSVKHFEKGYRGIRFMSWTVLADMVGFSSYCMVTIVAHA